MIEKMSLNIYYTPKYAPIYIDTPFGALKIQNLEILDLAE